MFGRSSRRDASPAFEWGFILVAVRSSAIIVCMEPVFWLILITAIHGECILFEWGTLMYFFIVIKLFSLSLCVFHFCIAYASTIISGSTLFSNTLRLRFSLNVIDKISHPYETTGKIIILCMCILIFKPSTRGHLNLSPYCGVGRFSCRVFKFWAKLCRSLFKLM
jgi:hypothetical protein